MSAAVVSFRAPVLAWAQSNVDESFYQRIQASVLTLLLIVAVGAKFLPTPEIVH